MGGACCKPQETELNPDGQPKDPQTEEQMKTDPVELRRACKDKDINTMETLLRRMPRAQMSLGSTKNEANAEDIGNSPLHYSAALNHLRAVKKLLLYGANPAAKNAAGRNPLHLAVDAGKRKVATFLLERCDPNAQDGEGKTVLLLALGAGRKRYAKWLMDSVPQINYDLKDKSGNTALHLLMSYGWWDMARDVLGKLQNPEQVLNIRNKAGETPLGWVLKYGGTAGGTPASLSPDQLQSLASALLERGASPAVPAFEAKVPPLSLAAAARSGPVFSTLLQKGAEPVAKDALGRTALHYAAAKGAVDIATQLIDLGLKPYDTDKSGNTPLHLAALRGQGPVGKLLIERADDPIKALTTTNKDGLSVFHLAMSAGPAEQAQEACLHVLQLLGEAVVDPKKGILHVQVPVQDKKKDNALMLAVGAHMDKVVKALLDGGKFDVNAPNATGETPLVRNLESVTEATYEQDAAIFDLLVNAGAATESEVEAQHPLLAVCKSPVGKFAEKAVGVLAAKAPNGALNWNKRDEEERTPLALAAMHGNVWLVKHLLVRENQDVNAKDRKGTTPLMYAAMGASTASLKVLLNKRADPNLEDYEGAPALKYCLRTDKADSLTCAAALLLMGAKPSNCTDITGEGLLHRAVRYGADAFIRLWARYGGDMSMKCTLPDNADDLPGDEAPAVDREDLIDMEPEGMEEAEEEEENINDEDDNAPPEGADAPAAAAPSAPAEGGSVSKAKRTPSGTAGATGAAPAADAAAPAADAAAPAADAAAPAADAATAAAGAPAADGGTTAAAAEEVAPAAPAAAAVSEPPEAPDAAGPGAAGGAPAAQLLSTPSKTRLPPLVAASPAPPAPPPPAPSGPQPVAEGAEWKLAGSWAFGLDADALSADPPEIQRFDSFYAAPPRGKLLAWAKQGDKWFDSWYRAKSAAPRNDDDDAWEWEYGEEQDELDDLTANGLVDSDEVLFDLLEAQRKRKRAGPVAESVAAAASNEQDLLQSVMARVGYAYDPARNEAVRFTTTYEGLASSGGNTSGGAGGVIRRQLGPGPVAESANRVAPEPQSSAAGNTSGKITMTARVEDKVRALTLLGCLYLLPLARFRLCACIRCCLDSASKWRRASYEGHARTKRPHLRRELSTHICGANEAPTIDNLQGRAMAGISKLLDNTFTVTDPYYVEATRYQGLPKYLDESVVDLSKISAEQQLSWAGELADRLGAYRDKDLVVPWLVGAELRARNIAAWHKSLPPEEYPLKLGQWRSQAKKASKAVEAAKKRRPARPGKKPQNRKKTAWFGLPDMPDRPELNGTSALIYAVRLCRATTVRTLLSLHMASLNDPDNWGYTPICYATYMLAKDRNNVAVQCIVDLLLERLPLVNFTSLDAPSVMHPLIHCVLLSDVPRMCHIVRKCVGSLNTAFVYLPHIPAYFQGLWEKQAGNCLSRVTPLHLAVLQRKFDMVKLVLDMGGNPNVYGQPLDAEKIKAKLKKERDEEMAEMLALAKELEDNGGKLSFKSKLKAGLMAKIRSLKKAISSIEIPGFTKPHPWVTPLHLACRFGLPEITFLLIKRGALVNGAGAAQYARKTPLQEALSYARSNFRVANSDAYRHNWNTVKSCLGDIPGMSAVAAAKEAKEQANKILALMDPTRAAIKAVALAAKAVILILMEMRKRPVAHWDPALAAAHVMLVHKSPISPSETQTQILLRDVMDNSTWRWITIVPDDATWVEEARSSVEELKQHEDFGYAAMSGTNDPGDYKQMKREFQTASDVSYYATGAKALHSLHRDLYKSALKAGREHVEKVYLPQIQAEVSAALVDYVKHVEGDLAKVGEHVGSELTSASAVLDQGVELVEEGAAEGEGAGEAPQPQGVSASASMKRGAAALKPAAAKPFTVPEARAHPGGAAACHAAVEQAAAHVKIRGRRAAEDQRKGFYPTAASAVAASEISGGSGSYAFISPTEPDAMKEAVVGYDTEGVVDMFMPGEEESMMDTFMGGIGQAQEVAQGLSDLLEYVGIADMF